MKNKIEIVDTNNDGLIDMRPLIKELELLYKQVKNGEVSIRLASQLNNTAGKYIEAAKVQLLLCALTKKISTLKKQPAKLK